MKILYAIQGTGNGHLSRAHEIVPILRQFAQVDILVSGNQSQIKAQFHIDYQRTGLTFLSGKKGGISIVKSLKNTHPIDFIKEIKSFPIAQYDLVLSDFEPVSAWSALVNNVPCIELSHQAGVIHQRAPKPDKNMAFGRYVLHHYVPTKTKYGFHFEAYEDKVFTPVIRREIRQATPADNGHYTVYLPGYHDDVLIHFLRQFPVKWEVFSKFATYAYRVDDVFIKPISQDHFQNSLISCTGVLAGAGFELPAEAMFLGKKVLVIPMKGHYEQACNALGAQKVGAMTIPELDLLHHRQINYWLTQANPAALPYHDETKLILERILTDFQSRGKQSYIVDEAFESFKEKLGILRYLL